jgi:hypothetical protein
MVADDVKILGTKQESYSGDSVLANPIIRAGENKAFSKVSAVWLESNCMTFDKGKEVLAEQQASIEDIRGGLNQWAAVATDDGVRFKCKANGRLYKPTEHAYNLMCGVGRGMSTWAVNALTRPIAHPTKKDVDGEPVPLEGGTRTMADHEVLVNYLNVHLFNRDRVDQEKPRLFRTWKDGTLRAVLSEIYTTVNNGWVLDLFSKLLPGGMLSHWRGDADEIYGNILIPDTIRAEKDSDFGGMVSIGNSEIGTRRISSTPSVFRAICMNGCIWNQEVGKEYNQVHRGKTLDFEKIASEIKCLLEAQIPLLPQGIQRVLGLRAYGVGDVPMQKIIGQIALDASMSKKQVAALFDGFGEERKIIGDEARTAYGLVNSITRAGQRFDNETWVRFDTLAGGIVSLDRNGWEKFRNRAANITDKALERVGIAV